VVLLSQVRSSSRTPRKQLLGLALALAAIAFAIPVSADAQTCAAAWSCSTSYAVGNQVSSGGSNYTLTAGPRSGCPGFNPSVDNWWTSNGTCSGGGATPTSTATATATATATTSSGTNVALNKAATGSASCNTTEVVAKAVNGTANGGSGDKFCSGVNPSWLQVDLGSPYNVTSFVVKHAAAGGEAASFNTRDFTIQLSSNGTTWTTPVTVTGNTANITTHNIASTSARYARLNVSYGSQTGATPLRIYEFEVYGNTSGATPTFTATKTATPTATSTPTATTNTTNTPAPTATSSGGGAGCAAAWISGTAYSQGAVVSRVCSGITVNYTANTWTQGNDPCSDNGINLTMHWSLPQGCGTINPPGGAGVAGVMTSGQLDVMFPPSLVGSPTLPRNAFYSFSGLVAGGNSVAGFCNSGTTAQKIRECAAFMANSALETQRGFYIDEDNKNGPAGYPYYCNPANTCAGSAVTCDTNHWYYGRGWLQLSWDANYCNASAFVYGANSRILVDNPNILSTDATVNTKASLWYWMTQHTTFAPQTSAHDCMLQDLGLGCTIAAINGPVECGGGSPPAVTNRGKYYDSFLSILGGTAVGGNGC
jgi:Chitinase class I/F5/8 type C domain